MPALALVLAVAFTAPPDAVAVADGIELLPGAFVPGRQPDGNTVMIRAPEGWVVVDTGRHAAHAERILAHARADGAPIVAIVNTHWHLDHVGGNPKLRAVHPDLVVHASDAIDAALPGFLANYRTQLEGLAAAATDADAEAAFRTEIALIDAGESLKPDRVVQASGDADLGGRTLRVGLERRAATAGDVWLHDAATRTLVAGDLVTLPAPFLDTACPARMRESLARLDALDFERLVPGHGAPMTREAFGRYRAAFGALLDCAASDRPADACVDGWIEGAAGLLGEADPKFVRGLVGYYVGEVLRGPPERIAAACAGP